MFWLGRASLGTSRNRSGSNDFFPAHFSFVIRNHGTIYEFNFHFMVIREHTVEELLLVREVIHMIKNRRRSKPAFHEKQFFAYLEDSSSQQVVHVCYQMRKRSKI